ncbi:MAG TPA: alpha/beta hydrolase [Anaerolineae bacterium]|nr:alpha/beta hydrolase [Anaerolineae bacterium]
MPHPILDQPEILRLIFHPRPDYPLAGGAPGRQSLSVEVELGISIGARLYPAPSDAPAILYWHGNGEIASDYDAIAPLYTGMGITLLVADYRGYGMSTGTPTCSNLLSDAVAVSRAADGIFDHHGLTPSRLYVMGRSLGSAAAIEVAAQAGARLAGLIVESGLTDTFALLARLGWRVEGTSEQQDGFGNGDKIAGVTVPTLIIHGEDDLLIPAQDGEELFQRSGAEDKRLLLIPGAGHNDLMLVGRTLYFDAIQTFLWGDLGGRCP